MFPTTHLTLEALSGIAGSISIACWLVVFSPQIIENFRRSSAEGLSIRFVIVWLSGDVFNVLGGVLQGVLPTMIILAVYYMLADIVLLSQCFYYKGFTFHDEIKDVSNSATEQSPLLQQNQDQTNPPRYVDGTHLSPAVPLHDPKQRRPAPRRSTLQRLLVNLTAVVLVIASGILGWWLSQNSGHRKKHPDPPHPDEDTLVFIPLGQVFGYICALLYLGSRFPQLLLNYRRKSTDGISMLFFLFACIGNLTYVLSVLAFDPICHTPGHCRPGEAGAIYARYFTINLSWLLGSFGTFLLDLIVFVQYFMYKKPEAGGVLTQEPGATESQPQQEAEEQDFGWHDNAE